MPVHHILVGTHSDQIHLVEFNSSIPSLTVRHALKLRDQPSWIVLSPTHPDLCYVNGWVDDVLFAVRFDAVEGFEVLGEARAGGGGPTHMEVTADGKALLSVNYRSGSLVYTPLLDNGLFAQSSPSSNQTHHFTFPRAEVTHPRQEAAHPHHLVLFGDDWLVPDLGSDKIWLMRWVGDAQTGSWEALRGFGRKQYDGPRHGVKSADGKHFYLVNELAATVSVLTLPSSPSDDLSALSSAPVLPPSLRNVARSDPYDLIPCTILLLAPPSSAPPNAPSTLLVSNRNAPAALAPDGDTFVLFSIPPNAPAQLDEPTFVHGAGRHLRGMAAGPPVGEDRERWVLVLGRDAGAMSVYERRSDGTLSRLLANVLGEVEKPVAAVWLPSREGGEP